jgi:hypothetical protein
MFGSKKDGKQDKQDTKAGNAKPAAAAPAHKIPDLASHPEYVKAMAQESKLAADLQAVDAEVRELRRKLEGVTAESEIDAEAKAILADGKADAAGEAGDRYSDLMKRLQDAEKRQRILRRAGVIHSEEMRVLKHKLNREFLPTQRAAYAAEVAKLVAAFRQAAACVRSIKMFVDDYERAGWYMAGGYFPCVTPHNWHIERYDDIPHPLSVLLGDCKGNSIDVE